jgi:hypothetical protein
MIEHTPWRGQNYRLGIGGQRIAIVAYSHHRKPEEDDHDGFTGSVVRDVITGKLKGDSLFAQVMGYFRYDHQATFWNLVMFFNFLPDCIGVTDQRYEKGTKEQIDWGKERFLRIIREKYPPHKVVVFTSRGWRDFPRTSQEEAGKARIPLGTNFPKFSWGTYACDDYIVMAFGLRHPQYASGQLMRLAVQHILKMPHVEGCSNWPATGS